MQGKTIWRGGYGDVKPVEVSRESHTLPDGALLEDHYETEMQAWAGILGTHDLAVECGLQRHQEALAQCATAREELVQRRLAHRKAVGAYDTWRRAYAAEMGEAV